MKPNYDSIAGLYDRLSRLVYGRSLINAQVYLLRAIPANAHVLIVGGGTGWVLEEIAKVHPSGLHITYVDASAKMVSLAQKKHSSSNQVTFITSQIEELNVDAACNVVLTPFFFDNFTNDSLPLIFSSINMRMAQDSIWLYCDFQDTDIFWQRVLLRIMYTFFRVVCGIEASSLPDVNKHFANNHYKVVVQKVFLGGFIASKIYKRELR